MVHRLLVLDSFHMVRRLFCSPQIRIVHRPFYSPRTVFIVRRLHRSFYSPRTVKIVCRLVAASTHWTLLRHQPSAGSILSSMASVRWTYFIVDLCVDRWPATAGLSPRVMMLSLSATGLWRRLPCVTSLFVRQSGRELIRLLTYKYSGL